MKAKELNIVYMGTPDFAVEPLRLLVEGGYNIVGVVTVPDKPQGRGQKVAFSSVKRYALEQGLNIMQPEKLKDEEFLSQMRALEVDLAVVVAFRMLPEVVWSMPRLGTFNLHASLLPNYRGAAPINRAVMDGCSESGVTTFMLDKNMDTGDIIDSRKVAIGEDMTAGELHDSLQEIGSKLVIETVDRLAEGGVEMKSQRDITASSHAAKIFKEDCQVDWTLDIDKIYNHIRGLSPYPAAWSSLGKEGVTFKIIEARKELKEHTHAPGTVIATQSDIKVACPGGYILINKLQMSGKRAMATGEFLRGNAKIFDK